MGCPAVRDRDQFDVRFMPANANHAPGDIAKQLASMYGLQKQRHNTMDGSSPSTFDHRAISALAQTPHFALSITPSQSRDMMGEDLTMEQLTLQLDLIEKAGNLVDQMQVAIAEIVNNIDNYTAEHLEQILSIVENTHTLDMVNDGRIALPTAEIEKIATETMDMMENLFNDDVLPPSLKEVSLPIIEKTAEIFQIPTLDTRIQEFKNNTSEVSKLEKTIEALKASLAELLLDDNLPEELREEIEDKLEKLESLEEGEPLPRELVQELNALSDQITEMGVNIPAELKAEIKANIEAVKEQNILARAEIHNMSPAQIRAIDSYIDSLETLQQNLPSNEDTISLKEIIADALVALDKNPASISAMAAVETVSNHISDPKVTQPIISKTETPTVLQRIFSVLQTQTKFVTKTQTDTISKNQNTSIAKVREASAIYRALTNAKKALTALIPANTNKTEAPKTTSTHKKPEIFTKDEPTSKSSALQTLSNQIDRVQKALNKSIDSINTTIELGTLATSKTFQNLTQKVATLRETPNLIKSFLEKNIQTIAKKFETPAKHPNGCPCCNTAFAKAAHLPIIGGIAQKLGIALSNAQQAKQARNLRQSFKPETDLSILNGPKKSTIQKLKDYLKAGCGGKSCASCGACATAFKKANGVKGLLQKVTSLLSSKPKKEAPPPSSRGNAKSVLKQKPK